MTLLSNDWAALRRPFPFAVASVAFSLAAAAQGDGARTYWKSLSGGSAINFWAIEGGGNTNPLDKARVVDPTADFDANLSLLGYHRSMSLFGRSAVASLLLPVGNLEAEIAGVPVAQQTSTSGYGDPTIQLDCNIYGAPAMTDLPSLMRYEPDFTLDALVTLAIPIGEYDQDSALNLGQNRWYGRIGAPMMWTLGPWVPGQRTTVELLPAVWLFGDNNDYQGGQTLSTDPIFGLEAHLTRDFTETMWGSIDSVWFSGGKSEIGGVTGSSIDNLGVGVTFGFQVNDNLAINVSYCTTVDDNDPGDVRGDEFRLMFTYGWHPLIQGMQRLSGH